MLGWGRFLESFSTAFIHREPPHPNKLPLKHENYTVDLATPKKHTVNNNPAIVACQSPCFTPAK
jgi:hypothetical protein